MIIILLVCLSLTCWIILRHQQHVMTLLYLAPFRKKRDFLALYDLHDNQSDFKEMLDHEATLDSYAAFLRLHQAGRADAFKTFKVYWDAISHSFAREYLIILVLLIPTYFYGELGLFVVLVFAIQGLFVVSELLKKHNRDYYIGAIISLIHVTISKAK